MSESDADHLADLWKIKLKRLRELDKQAAMLGDAQTPAHIQVERGELRAEMGLLDGIASLPIRPQFGEELGPNGRLFAYLAEAKRANDGIAQQGERFGELLDELRRWQTWIWRGALAYAAALVVLGVALAVVITVLIVRG